VFGGYEVRKHGSFKVLASVFIVLFILVTPFTSEIVKEQLIIGDIGTAGWIELWGDRLASLSRGI